MAGSTTVSAPRDGVVPPERSFLAVRRAVRRPPPERLVARPSGAASGTSVTAASAPAESAGPVVSAGAGRDCCGTRAPWPVAAGCLRAAELAALATAVTPSFAGRKAAGGPGQSPADRAWHATPTLSCDPLAQGRPQCQVAVGRASHRPQSPRSAVPGSGNPASAPHLRRSWKVARTTPSPNPPPGEMPDNCTLRKRTHNFHGLTFLACFQPGPGPPGICSTSTVTSSSCS